VFRFVPKLLAGEFAPVRQKLRSCLLDELKAWWERVIHRLFAFELDFAA
jgi:hypothetical protein